MRDENDKLAGDGRSVSLERLLDTQVAMLSHTQSVLKAELDLVRPGNMLSEKLVKQLDLASKAIATAVASKISLTKRLKEMGDSMSPTELDDAAIDRIKDMPFPYRGRVLVALAKYHNAERQPRTMGAGFGGAKSAIHSLQEAQDGAVAEAAVDDE